MNAEKITLLLGAGASIGMGYPVGEGLRQAIINDTYHKYAKFIIGHTNFHIESEDVRKFVDQFKYSQMASIDAFLARRPEYAEVGKRAIASIILEKENANLLHSSNHNDNWYRYFYNKISAEKWVNLDLSNISIVTFNYDRSLEFFLINAMMASYSKTFKQCYTKLKELKIIHVYGSVGHCDPDSSDYFEYGEKLNSRMVSVAASMIKVIPEGRDEDETLELARKELLSADRIGILGFGFDQIN